MTDEEAPQILRPDWSVPPWVRAYSTTRYGGVSLPPWDSFNLADYVGDNPTHVAVNRQRLQQRLRLPSSPYWLRQSHGTVISQLDTTAADATFSTEVGAVCVVQTADCLPVLLTNQAGDQIAAVHAGWRGLAAGILEACVAHFRAADQVIAWLGPAISQQAFVVGEEVRTAFMQQDAKATHAFIAHAPGKWRADLYQLARQRLRAVGVGNISGGGCCTYTDARFYSFRRMPQTGRMATLIWIGRY